MDADPIDYSERAGFQVGKAVALADWRHKKEKGDFAVLVNRLRVKKWQRENLDKKRAKGRAWAAAHAAEQLNYQRECRRKRARARGEVYFCKHCGTSWCPVPWARGKQGRGEFCGHRCYHNWRYANDEAFRERWKARSRAIHAKRRAARAAS